MSDPYDRPKSALSVSERRWAHVVVAFLSALLLLPLLAYGVLVAWAQDYHVVVKREALVTVVVGAFLSAAAIYRHRRAPLWLAALGGVGVGVVLILAIAPSIWAGLLSRGAA